MKPIVVVGSINMDLVSRTDRIPGPGETVIGSGFEMHSGGKGANQAVAAARLGYRSVLLGAIGDDIFGQNLLSTLNSYGVDTTYILQVPEASGTASIVVDSTGENTIIVTPGANRAVTAEYLETKIEVIKSAGIVLTQLEIPVAAVEWLADCCSRYRVPFILDPAPARSLPSTLMPKVTWFTPNQTEAAFYSDHREATEHSVFDLLNSGVQNVILKQGAAGVLLATSEGIRTHIDAFAVDALDTTAAGDAFNGAFAVALMRGESPEVSARFAAAAAAVSVTRRGAQPSLATQEETLALLKAQGHSASTLLVRDST